jgi:hypothetical protein
MQYFIISYAMEIIDWQMLAYNSIQYIEWINVMFGIMELEKNVKIHLW